MMNGNTLFPFRQSEQILNHLNDGIIFCNEEGIITFANEAACLMVGLSCADLAERPITDVLTRLPLLAAANTAQTSQFELNGRYVEGQASTIYTEDNQVQGILATLRDITSEYEAEQAKDGFLRTISHELRTPLTAIKGYIELLAAGTGGTLNNNQEKFATAIQRNVNRMVQLINSLIFASSIKGGRLERIDGHTDLAQLIRQISRELQPTAAEDGQRIICEIDEDLQPLQVDPIHMATILEELMTNSIKFNRPGGEVRVTAVSETGGQNQQSFVIVTISDEGIGIDPADEAHIFEEFYRAAELSNSHIRTRGMGMGLSIVRALVEAYDGRIWFKSTPNQGSAFTFIIPNQMPDQLLPPPVAG
jgi:PAS domain S-box-containing protein